LYPSTVVDDTATRTTDGRHEMAEQKRYRNWKKWVAIYVVAGLVIYGLIYLILTAGGGGGGGLYG
jgi:hypothetical protein